MEVVVDAETVKQIIRLWDVVRHDEVAPATGGNLAQGGNHVVEEPVLTGVEYGPSHLGRAVARFGTACIP